MSFTIVKMVDTELSNLRLRNQMFNKKDKAEEEITEVAFEDLEPTE